MSTYNSLNFFEFGNLAIQRMESQPKLATSYSLDNSNKHKSGIWQSVQNLCKVSKKSVYLRKRGQNVSPLFIEFACYW